MKFPRIPAIAMASTALLCAAPALADHNSQWGEGWANMPNDIHNTRIDTRAADDNDAFKDFVRYGNGADSVNRYAEEDEGATPRKMQQKASRVQQSTGDADVGAKKQSRQTVETRQSSRVRQSVGTGGSRSQSGARQGGGGRGGH